MIALIYCHFQCSRGKFQLEFNAGALTVNRCCHSHSSCGEVPPNLIYKGMTAPGKGSKKQHFKCRIRSMLK